LDNPGLPGKWPLKRYRCDETFFVFVIYTDFLRVHVNAVSLQQANVQNCSLATLLH